MNRLRDLREERNLTQEKVAKALGIGQAGYSKYECEKIDIPTDILLKLSDYYNTSIDYILCRTNNKNPYKKSEKYDKIIVINGDASVEKVHNDIISYIEKKIK